MIRTQIAIIGLCIKLAAVVACALDYDVGIQPAPRAAVYDVGLKPAQQLPNSHLLPRVAAPALKTPTPARGYDASRPWQEWADDFAPYGYGQYGKIVSVRVLSEAESLQMQRAMAAPRESYGLPPAIQSQPIQPRYMTAPASFSMPQFCTGPGCRTCQ